MEDMGDNRANGQGKHNLDFEDHKVLFFFVYKLKHIQHGDSKTPAAAHYSLKLPGRCVTFGFCA